jgi:CDP-ribitol ribitolphosphotransferase / teichoic acid ribitol-phosphate polymerase
MHEVYVEDIEWKRVHVTLRGRIEPVDPGTPVDLDLLVLENTRTDEQILLPPATVVGDTWFVRFNSMQVCEQYPLAIGDWRLCYPDANDYLVPVRMDADLSISGFAYGGLFSAQSYRYWLVPTVEMETGAFCLSVNYRIMGREHEEPNYKPKRRRGHTIRVLRNHICVLLYHLIRQLTRKNGKRILFTSDSRPEMSGNLQHIYERMLSRGLNEQYTLYKAFKPSITAKRPFLEKFLFPYYLARADVILLDDFHPMLYKVEFDPSVRIIQVWHASGAFKTVGYSRIGKPGGPSPFSNAHKNYTHAIVSAPHDVPFYAEAFGVPDERVVPTGIPRMDLFFDPEHIATTREIVHDAVPMTRDRKVILFAPTFRGTGPSNAYYDYEQLDLPALYRLCVQMDAVCVFKMHPFVIEPLEIPEAFADRFIDATTTREINDFLFIADLVITDYSSLVFEYSTLNRPMLFFAYDLEEYISTRDFYEEFVEFVPGKIVRTFDEMLTAIQTGDFEHEKVRPFAETHLGHLNAGSTDRVIDVLVLGAETL